MQQKIGEENEWYTNKRILYPHPNRTRTGNDSSLQVMVDLSSTIHILQGDKFVMRQKEYTVK